MEWLVEYDLVGWKPEAGSRKPEAGSGQISERFRAIGRTADLIHIPQDGRLVQQGAFDKLFHVEALFRDLALRQMA